MQKEYMTNERDIELAYNILLGRQAESVAICKTKVDRPISFIIPDFWNSPEFHEDVFVALTRRIGAGDRFSGHPSTRHIRWIAHTFPLSQEGLERLASIGSWSALYRLFLTDTRMLASLDEMSIAWDPEDLLKGLTSWPVTFARSIDRTSFTAGNAINDIVGEASILVPADFDARIYGRYDDASSYKEGLRRHYIEVGAKEGRVFSQESYNHRRRMIAEAIDEKIYRSQRPKLEDGSNIIDDWIFFGSINDIQPNNEFSTSYYVDKYPDIANNYFVDAFEHFIKHGKAEGRQGVFPVKQFLREGRKEWNLTAPTIAIACHEASRTGAPLVGLSLLRRIGETHNIILFLPRGGDLLEEFEEECVQIVFGWIDSDDAAILIRQLLAEVHIEGMIFNSVETSYLADAVLQCDIPSVALIHEFASYTRPVKRMTLMAESVDVVVVPAEIIKDALQEEVSTHRHGQLNNIVVRPQGYLPRTATIAGKDDLTEEDILSLLSIEKMGSISIVLGAGTVQIRKGVDLFIQTAAAVKQRTDKPVKFIWVGEGYDPDKDGLYSLWLHNMVVSLDVDKDIFFIPAQKQLDVIMNIADVFFLSSRMDPFPNVALDAFAADKPVICFQRSTGISEAMNTYHFAGTAVPHADVHAAAEQILVSIKAGPLKGHNRALIDRHYAFDEYADDIMKYLEQAKKITAQRIERYNQLEESGYFNAEFHEGKAILSPASARAALRQYVARGDRGVFAYNPRPGFSELASRKAETVGPALLDVRYNDDKNRLTHESQDLDALKADWSGNPPSVAFHLHMHYADLANEFAELLATCQLKADIVITTNDKRTRIECEYAFRDYTGGDVSVIEVENRGRDIQPFIQDFAKHIDLQNYEVVGHFHGKQSVVNEAGVGDRWRRHMTSTLIGDAENLRKLLSLFQSDSGLGLIFAEDRHSVGWTKNKPFGEKLANRLSPRPAVPEQPIFPLGTMFWARTEALRSVWEADDLLAGMPREPLPYDATILHAFERMVPVIVESNGLSWMTVHRSGKGW